jgi:hypothetical protein
MGDVVNLRRARKRRAVAEAETAAAAKRVEYGISKNARSSAEAESAKATSRLEAHRIREPGDAD